MGASISSGGFGSAALGGCAGDTCGGGIGCIAGGCCTSGGCIGGVIIDDGSPTGGSMGGGGCMIGGGSGGGGCIIGGGIGVDITGCIDGGAWMEDGCIDAEKTGSGALPIGRAPSIGAAHTTCNCIGWGGRAVPAGAEIGAPLAPYRLRRPIMICQCWSTPAPVRSVPRRLAISFQCPEGPSSATAARRSSSSSGVQRKTVPFERRSRFCFTGGCCGLPYWKGMPGEGAGPVQVLTISPPAVPSKTIALVC
mmetsp:Transcript_60685/g.100764  ORF Transcript_60685/g.100764 Transcript_60685/m.100764 type:complete len:251 (+) Transcript_60685:244-996(+)